MHVMRICESENLSLLEKRVATAFAFTHDSFYIRRIMEADIERPKKEAERIERTDPERAHQLRQEAARLEEKKQQQRAEHMSGGAENAKFLLGQIEHPSNSGVSLMSPMPDARRASLK
jgi:hypothetical protein